MADRLLRKDARTRRCAEGDETPEGAGSHGRRGRLHGACSQPPFAGSSDAFGSYKSKGAARICLHNYLGFLLSETVEWVTPC
ncbi:hypothetical protein GCM10010250_58310 [Streptomyces althioticus]|nr:hypothetical protein GCM10010250_58310 [Streptomyces althioticus]